MCQQGSIVVLQPAFRYEMKATGRADLAANEKVLDLYTSNLQLEDQLHGVRKEVQDAKTIAEKVVMLGIPADWLHHQNISSKAHIRMEALSKD